MTKETTLAVETKTSVLAILGLGLITAFSGFAMSAFLLTAGTVPTSQFSSVKIVQQPNAQALTSELIAQATSYQATTDQAEKNNQLVKIQQLAEKRTNKLLALAAKNSVQLRSALIDTSVRESLPADVQALVEQTVNLTGDMTTRIAENPETGLDQHIHLLKSGDTTYRLALVGELQASVITGPVTIDRAFLLDSETAVVLDESAVTETGSLESTAIDATTTTQTTTALTERKVAVFVFKFQDTTSGANMTTDQARQIMFTNTNSINAWFKEASFDQVGLTGKQRPDGDVFGVFTLPMNAPTSASGCDVDAWKAAADQQATQQGADLTGYDHYIYAFPLLYPPGSTTPFQICSFAGLSDINGKLSWIQGTPNYFNLRVVPHEIGHNLGLHHAEAYNCFDSASQRVTLSTLCTALSYFDPLDEMANNPFVYRHFSAHRKVGLGWATASNMQNVTASGTYTIAPMETASTGVQTLRIHRPSGTSINNYYYLEFRQPFGQFDNFAVSDPAVNGVLVRLGAGSAISTNQTGLGGRSFILDMTPETAQYNTSGAILNSSYNDAALAVGKTFSDPDNGITITTDSVSATGAQVTITIAAPVCTPAAPTIAVNPPQSGYDGIPTAVGQTFVITNRDSAVCPPALFNVTPSLPAGWSQTATPVTINPGQAGTISIKYTPPAGTLAGVYSLGETFTHGSPDVNASVNTTYTVLNAESTPPTVSISAPPANSRLPSKGKVNVAAAAQDLSGVAKIEIFIDDASVKVCTNVTSCAYSWTMNSRVASGSHTIKAVATDKSPRANTATTQITVTK